MIPSRPASGTPTGSKPRASGDDPNNEYKTFNNML